MLPDLNIGVSFCLLNVCYPVYCRRESQSALCSLTVLLSPLCLLCGLCVLVASSIIQVDDKCFPTTGVIAVRRLLSLQCHLIIAQMSRTRCQLVSSILYPLMCVVGSSLMLQLQSVETCLLWIYCAFITTVHMHFGVSVVRCLPLHSEPFVLLMCLSSLFLPCWFSITASTNAEQVTGDLSPCLFSWDFLCLFFAS